MNRSRETVQFIQARRYQRPHAPPPLARAALRSSTKNYWLPFRCTVIAAASVRRPAASFHPLVAQPSCVHAVHQLHAIRNVSTCSLLPSHPFSLSLSRFSYLSIYPSVSISFHPRNPSCTPRIAKARRSFLSSTKNLRRRRFITDVRRKASRSWIFQRKIRPSPRQASLLLYEIFMAGAYRATSRITPSRRQRLVYNFPDLRFLPGEIRRRERGDLSGTRSPEFRRIYGTARAPVLPANDSRYSETIREKIDKTRRIRRKSRESPFLSIVTPDNYF